MNGISSIRPFVPAEVKLANLGSGGLGGQASSVSPRDLQKVGSVGGAQSTSGSSSVQGGFGNMLSDLVQEVDNKQAIAAENTNALMAGENVSLHTAMIAMEEANVSFQLMVEVRNKLLESYQELMRMQV